MIHLFYPSGHLAYCSCFGSNYLSNESGHILRVHITQTLSRELKAVKWGQRMEYGLVAKQINWSNLLAVPFRPLCSDIGIEHIG